MSQDLTNAHFEENRKRQGLTFHEDEQQVGEDKSRKGSVDVKILKLVEGINLTEDFFTTSSCSGRAILFTHVRKSNQLATQQIKQYKWMKSAKAVQSVYTTKKWMVVVVRLLQLTTIPFHRRRAAANLFSSTVTQMKFHFRLIVFLLM